MAKRRFRELGSGSCFGSLVYERAVPQGHFLRRLERPVEEAANYHLTSRRSWVWGWTRVRRITVH